MDADKALVDALRKDAALYRRIGEDRRADRFDATADLLNALMQDVSACSPVELVAANQRAAQAESRLYSLRQFMAAKARALREFIERRAPELWSDFAAISVNGSIYSDSYRQEPTFEREMNILRHRAEAAEDRALKAELRLIALGEAI